jgi:hypothetical protein
LTEIITKPTNASNVVMNLKVNHVQGPMGKIKPYSSIDNPFLLAVEAEIEFVNHKITK